MIKLSSILNEIKLINKITPEMILNQAEPVFNLNFSVNNDWFEIFYNNGIDMNRPFDDINSYKHLSQNQLKNIFKGIIYYKQKYNIK